MKRLLLAAVCASALLIIGLTVYFAVTKTDRAARAQAADETGARDGGGGPLDNATVSFGAWKTTPALDRFPNNSPRPANLHALTPRSVKIKAGGTVNFVIAGFHQVIVYDDGTQPGDIDTTLVVAPTGPGGLPPILINDPENRIYRGLDPSLLPQDRVEVVQFDRPGLYLVICGVLPHFQEGMYAYVRVLPNGRKPTDAGR